MRSGPERCLTMVLIATLLGTPAAAAEIHASLAVGTEHFANGGFDSGDTKGWKLNRCRVDLRTVEGRSAPSAALVSTGDNLMAFQTVSGVGGKVLVIRGSVLLQTRGITTQFYTRFVGSDKISLSWVVQAFVAPGPEWQDFAFVVPVVDGATAVDVGLLHEGDSEVVIDDWSVVVR